MSMPVSDLKWRYRTWFKILLKLEMQVSTTLVFVAVLLGTCVIGSFGCPENMYTGHDGLCCRFCPEGTHLIKPCNESNGRSFCQQCPPQTYMDKANNESECEPCIKCGPSQVAQVECAPNKNRECGCEKGKYLDLSVIFCLSCKECPKGEGVTSPCKKNANTKCQPCPKGTFSDNVSYQEACKPCTICDGMMIVKQECNASRDTICERTNVSQAPITPSESLESVSLTNQPTGAGNKIRPILKEDTQKFKYIIAIASVGFILFLILASACWYVMRKRGTRNDSNNQTEETAVTEYNFPVPATTLETPAQARSSRGLRGRRMKQARNNSHPRETDSQGSNSSLQGVSIEKGKNTMVRELPSHIYMELGKLLNPKSFNNWITLAGRLGFNNSDVKNFELFPEDATQRTLEEWGQRDESTVGVLINVLKEMKRDDCVEILKPWDS